MQATLILSAFMQYPHYLRLLDSMLLKGTSKESVELSFFLSVLYNKYNHAKKACYTIDNLIIELEQIDLGLTSEQRDLFRKFLMNVPDESMSEDQADEIIKEFLFYTATKHVLPTMSKDKGVSYLNKLYTALTYAPKQSILLSLKEDINQIQEIYSTLEAMREFPTGLPQIDAALQGGLGRGELGVLQASTNVGKSWYLLNVAHINARKGHNVIFVSLEMNEREILKRLATLVLHVSSVYIETYGAKIAELMTDYVQNELKGNLYILRSAPFEMSIHDFEKKLEQLELVNAFPDLIVLDYADLFRMGNGMLWDELGKLYAHLQRLALHYNVGIWTASQLNKEAMKHSDRTGLQYTSGSIEKVNRADIVIHIEVLPDGSRRARIVKSRRSRKAIEQILIPDFESGDLVGSSDQTQLVDTFNLDKFV